MLEYNGDFVYKHAPWVNAINVNGAVRIGTVECDSMQGVISNDLRHYYDKLLSEGKVDDIQAFYFDQIVVGEGFCGLAIHDFLEGVFNHTAISAFPSSQPSSNPSEMSSSQPSNSPSESLSDVPSPPSESPSSQVSKIAIMLLSLHVVIGPR